MICPALRLLLLKRRAFECRPRSWPRLSSWISRFGGHVLKRAQQAIERPSDVGSEGHGEAEGRATADEVRSTAAERGLEQLAVPRHPIVGADRTGLREDLNRAPLPVAPRPRAGVEPPRQV